ncbi:MAG: hypothetical protein RLZZ210_1047 [Pseudomonadota bacterium]
MSELIQAIHKAQKQKSELIASTLRLPEELHSFVDEFAEHLGISRQEALIALVKEGKEVATKELDKEDVINNKKYKFYLLNTNKSSTIDDQRMMISEKIAAAFCNPWKVNIDSIKKGDTVFLYSNGVGIIAYGTATGVLEKRAYSGIIDNCHYQDLENFHILEKPLSAKNIKKILDGRIVFLRTMSGISEGQKILDAINNNK